MLRWLSPLAALVLLLGGHHTIRAESALPAPAEQATFAAGAIAALKGTPHLWIADESGTLHWSGDTRALAGHAVDWGNRREVTVDELKGLKRGAPWLSAGLLKDGDPIYFVKWETSQTTPQLLHIQSIADVELFGIDGANYGQFVLDRTAWEQRFGFSAQSLTRGVLAGAVAAPAATSAATSASSAAAKPVLAGALTTAEQTAFLESVADSTRTHRTAKWVRPIRVELRRSTYDSQGPLTDDIVNEVSGLINGLGISRVASNGDIVIDFVPLAEIRASRPTALGYASYYTTSSGALGECTITVAHDPESYYGSLAQRISPQMKTDLLGLVVRHEFAHCLGLGHNQSTQSFLSYNFDGLDSYYTSGSRTARYGDFDRALIRTLYHASITPGMPESAIKALFGS